MFDRVIFHCDCNSFYASVELLQYPELREKPVAVSGSIDNRHGIILAKNEAAKKYDVKTAETVWQARQKCPQLILLPPHGREYRKISKIINEIYAEYTDRVEPFGIDESWLDVTSSWQLFGGSPKEVADQLRARIKRETGLTISVGISDNKIFAKLASDYQKPDATTEFDEERVQSLVWPLPVTALLFVGKRAAETLAELGIKTIGQLAAADEALLTQIMGKLGRQLKQHAMGEDASPVALIGESEPIKSVGNGLTFRRDLVGYRDVRVGVGSLADEVATRLRKYGLYATTLQVLIKDPDLKSISRQKQLNTSTQLAQELTHHAMELVQNNWDMAKPIRMLTITAAGLTDIPFAQQTSLLGEEPQISDKREKLEKSIDKIRDKYGRSVILEAGALHNDIGVTSKASPEDDIVEINKKEQL